MLRKLRVAIVTCLVSIGALAVAPSVATAAPADWPTSPWDLGASSTGSTGGLIWYNRSVGVQGSVWDYGDGYTQMYFLPFVGATARGDRDETRTVTEGYRSFHFDLYGSDISGGFTSVLVERCWFPSAGGFDCDAVRLYRP